MVTDINAIPVSTVSSSNSAIDNNSAISTNSPDNSSFADALSKTDSKNATNTKDASNATKEKSNTSDSTSTQSGDSSDSEDYNVGDSTESLLTTKTNDKSKADIKSPLSKALNGEDINYTDKDSTDTKSARQNAKGITAVTNTTLTAGSVANAEWNADDQIPQDLGNDVDTKLADKKQDTKKLSDISKEAQARNLNLQKIEIIEKGMKNEIKPQDLVDKQTILSNKEKLSTSLQNMGAGFATSIASASANINEDSTNQQEKLLAELLNKFDAKENAKRKVINDAEKLNFKVGDGDKVIIINRGANLPENIVSSKIRNVAMHQDFLEKLHEITGDEDLADVLLVNRNRLENMQKMLKTPDIKVDSTKPYQGLITQGQTATDVSALNTLSNQVGSFDMDTQKPFDTLISNTMKAQDTKNDYTTSTDTTTTEDKKEDKPKEKVESKQDVGVASKQEVSIKNAIAREAIRNFASQFRSEVLNYKPPVTKINLELNPENLGQVSMTISKKGNDLQVSITSNANVMIMFVQNAQELRQNLMQIGFNNLDLNFSARDGNAGGGTASNGNADSNASNIKSVKEAQSSEEIPESMEITLPDYA